MREFNDQNVKVVFDAYPDDIRGPLLDLRELIFAAAGSAAEIGPLTETLKWGQPAYLPQKPKTGTTVRIDALKNVPGGYGLFVHCQTSLLDTFQEIYPGLFHYEGNRALHFTANEPPSRDALQHCISLAFTYHLRPG